MKKVYLDHNATAPLAPGLYDPIAEWLHSWGNPSSIHWAGREPKAMLRSARQQIARMIQADPLEIIFTSGATEANNLALKGFFERSLESSRLSSGGSLSAPGRLIISAVEHPSVARTARYLAEVRGIEVIEIPVSRGGQLDLDSYRKLFVDSSASTPPRPTMVSVMLANNETGNVFPIAEMVEIAHRAGAIFHTDMVQALGKKIIDVKSLGVDLASFSGHKFYALKGVGGLYIRKGLFLPSLIHGGPQERARRGGTENALAIASLGWVAENFTPLLSSKILDIQSLRDEFEKRILREVPGVRVTGMESERLSNTSSLVIDGIDGETLLMNLDLKGFAVSTGAACSSGSPEPSPVLLNMGLKREEAQSSLRVALGWETTQQNMLDFTQTLIETLAYMRSLKL